MACRKPIPYYCDIANASNVIGYDDLFDSLMNLDQAVYAPMNYTLPSRLAKYEAKYDVKVGNSTLKQVNREKSLQRLMTINMLKRLESCVDSFRTTLKNVEQVNADTLKAIQEYESHRNSAVEASHEFTNIDPDDYESEEDF